MKTKRIVICLVACAVSVFAQDDAALKLFNALDTSKTKTFVFSPYSAITAMQMAQLGADGNTRAELDAALGNAVPGAAAPGKIDIVAAVNAAFVHQNANLKNEFAKQLEETFGASAIPVNFNTPDSARNTINGWVAGKTRNMIKELLPAGSIDRLTRIVLVNAVYFKGEWRTKFNPNRTRPWEFISASAKKHTVQMMRVEASFDYAFTNGVQVLVMPYGNGGAMTVFLPSRYDLTPAFDLLPKASGINFKSELVNLAFPKFTIMSNHGLIPAFKELGIRDAFTASADFSKMFVNVDDIYISSIIQAAIIVVDEQGTVAAAATAVSGVWGAPPPPPKKIDFIADRPFLFTITAPDGTILFAGAFREP